MNTSFRLNKDYALDINLFCKYRDFSDGVDFIELHVWHDRYKADHKPSFDIWFSILNICLFELNIYNIHHDSSEA